MTTLARRLEKNNVTVTAALVMVLGALLLLSPAEATLGNVVKIVYLHGAAERVAAYTYLISALVGLVQLARPVWPLSRWTRSSQETAIVFWLAQGVISLPAQVLAWGGLMWNEPRVVGALWILGLTLLTYAAARWIGDPSWMAVAACANAAILVVVLRGGIDVLHPLNPILGSDSVSIKLFYAAIVLVTGTLAVQFARYRAAGSAKPPWQA